MEWSGCYNYKTLELYSNISNLPKHLVLCNYFHTEESDFIRVFDDDNSGAMDFAEYMLAINATNLNTPQAFLCFIFSIHIFSWMTLCRKNLIGEGSKKKKNGFVQLLNGLRRQEMQRKFFNFSRGRISFFPKYDPSFFLLF